MNINSFSTSDLSLASAISLWFPIDFIDKSNPNKVVFNFKRVVDLDKVVEAFWKRELKVDPLSYFQQVKIIKSQIHEKGWK